MSQKRTKNEPQRTKNEPQRTIFRKSKYQCVCCEYITFKKANSTRHMASKKHFKNITLKESSPEKPESSPKKPESSPDTENVEINDLKKQVKQLTNLVGILVEKGVSTTNNTNCNNTIINNHITVDVYLGDHWKNALNIKDFVDQIQVKLEDCVYPSSKLIKDNIVSNLFMNNLNKLSNEERPVHCADARRGKFFVKDNDEWTEIKKEEPLNPLNSQIGMLKLEVYKKAGNFEEEGLIKEDKKQKIRDACEISGPPTKINNKIVNKIASDCSLLEARKKKSLENID